MVEGTSYHIYYQFKGDISMKKLFIFLVMTLMIIVSACSPKKSDSLVLVKGGTFANKNSNYYEKKEAISSFYIAKYEITQKEWLEIMDNNPSTFKGDDLPVETVSWYDCIEYCNKRSVKEGLKPYYNINKDKKDPDNRNDNDSIKCLITINEGANGYRLPSETEWEYASGGGQKTKNFIYSGSDKVDDVAWYWKNAGNKPLSGNWNWPAIENNKNKTKSVGTKKPNELGIYDMSGNVREWCFDWYIDLNLNSGYLRVCKGGGWIGDEHCCEPSYRGKFDPNGMGSDQGFRVCRNK